MGTHTVDAVVIGAGHHGLVAAATLADAGWDVLVLEERDRIGGAVASSEQDGFVFDDFSSCHPLARVSPVLRNLELESHGLSWATTDQVLTHVGDPTDSVGSTLLLDPEQTAAALEDDHHGDGAGWLRLVESYRSVKQPLLDALLTQWPPSSTALRLLRRVGAFQVADFARFATLPCAQLGAEYFGGSRGQDLLAGNAAHADIPMEAPGSGIYGWLLSMVAQDVGFPSPRGGTGRLAEALGSRARAAGAEIETRASVAQVLTSGDRATGVRLADGRSIAVRRAVIADTSAPRLYKQLLRPEDLPPGVAPRLARFAWDLPTVKLNYRLSADVPWTAVGARSAGVVHVGRDHRGLIRWAAELGAGSIPERPFALVGQMSTIDRARSPDGTQSLWLYTHLPRGVVDDHSAELLKEAAERMLDDFAPGWRELVLDSWVQRPSDLFAADANLGHGAVGGGTMQLFQQLFWRPFTGLGGPRTPVGNLYLGSAAIHPGGGVHGACGFLAARAALHDNRWWGRPMRRLTLGALHRLYAEPPAY